MLLDILEVAAIGQAMSLQQFCVMVHFPFNEQGGVTLLMDSQCIYKAVRVELAQGLRNLRDVRSKCMTGRIKQFGFLQLERSRHTILDVSLNLGPTQVEPPLISTPKPNMETTTSLISAPVHYRFPEQV